MNNILRKSFLLLTILLVSLELSFLQPDASLADNVDEAVTITAIDFEGEELIETTVVDIEDGYTAMDVLEHVADSVDHDSGFIHGINEIYSDWDAYQNWWSFIVNGKYASEGASAYEVNHGDNILFLLSDSMDENVEVSVSAMITEENILIDDEVIQLAPYSTVYDAIVQAAIAQELILDVTVDSQWLTFINDLDEAISADNEFWELAINEKPLQVGALAYQLTSGESVLLQLTTFGDLEEGEGSTESETDKEDSDSGKNADEADSENGEDGIESEENDNVAVENVELTEEQKKTFKQVQDNIKLLTQYVYDNNLATEYGQEWWVWALGKAESDVPKQYSESIEKLLLEAEGEISSVTELEKIIIALSHTGVDVSNFSGYNLIDQLVTHPQLENPINISAAVYGLIAFNSAAYGVDTQFENRLIDYILDAQLDGGGWTYFGDDPSVDITAMTLIALASYQDKSQDVKEAIDQAVSYLSEAQAENGAYYDQYNGGYAGETVAQVIIGLTSVGIDPTSPAFTKEINLLESLFLYRADDGLYKHLKTDDSSNGMATQQALLALAFYNAEFGPEDEPIVPPVVPEDPVEPTESTEPTEPIEEPETDEENNGNEENVTESEELVEEGKQLPKTSTNMFNILAFGILLFTVGFVIIELRRRWKEE